MKTSATPARTVLSHLFLFLAALVAVAASAWAGSPQLYAETFNDRYLLTVDTNTGAGTLITNFSVKAMDLATYRGGLYLLSDFSGSHKLSEIDAQTGEILRQISFGHDFAGGEGAFDFRADGVIFATRSSSATGTVFRLETTRTNTVLVTPEGGLSPSLDGLAFDHAGTLFGLSQNRGGRHALYLVDPDSGQTTLVGDLGITFAAGGLVVAGLAFAPDGTLYAALGGATDSWLCRVNKTTGVATVVGSIGYPGVAGIRFYQPLPGPLAVRLEDGQVRVSWPHARGGILEFAARLGEDWAKSSLPVTTNGSEAVVLTPRDGEQGWFRLKL
ncbi:MAG: hypothetical protein HZA90_23730 [Verrucomicrobia bacterium]|nr:hypothetical protein [Verrucomicrobiota bacterium]